MVAHQGFLSFFNCSSRFLSESRPIKLYSKINMVLNTCLSWRVQAFFISHSEVQFFLPYRLRWCYIILDNLHSCFAFHMLSGMRYFKSINLFVGVILCHISPKAFPKECCYLWCLSMIQVFSYPLGKSSFHLFVDFRQAFVFGSARISPQILRSFP